MKQAVIITSAGLSTRFSESIGHEVFKILYTEHPDQKCILALQLDLLYELNVTDIILVGGNMYDELSVFIEKKYPEANIKLIFNEHFHDMGTAHSLALGIEALEKDYDQIIFMEGDLFFDLSSFKALLEYPEDVISISPGPIVADKSVAFYLTVSGNIHYIYDSSHQWLEVSEPFKMIANSGQVWKFSQQKKLKEITTALTPSKRAGSNLNIISAYFQNIEVSGIKYIEFRQWFNCNTINDYREITTYSSSLSLK